LPENKSPMTDPETLCCYAHPDRETMLRCNNCERPICAKCAILTPTGYRCRECVRGQQKVFETATAGDFIAAPLVAGVLSFLASFLVPLLGFFTIFLAPIAGTGIGEIVSQITHRRRSKNLFYLISGAVVIGALPHLLITLFSFFTGLRFGGFNFFGLLPLVWQVVYVTLCTGSVFYRLAGFKL
jgi:hypothetical protein